MNEHNSNKVDERAEAGKKASVEGFAHEHIAAGILMKKYQNVSLVDLPHSTYDCIIVFKVSSESEDIIRAQVKTAKNTISFTGGTRGGVDRTYKSGVKSYKQTKKTADVVIGVHPVKKREYELYFVPTVLVEHLDQSSISLSRITPLKENYDMLERCKDEKFVIQKSRELGIVK